MSQALDAIELKKALWETLQGVKDGSVTPQNADAIASQAREILRCAEVETKQYHDLIAETYKNGVTAGIEQEQARVKEARKGRRGAKKS